jgi:5'-methylthioadenosine phosphorylase
MKIGIIGGTGLDDPKLLKNAHIKTATTKYGTPSSDLTTGTIFSTPVVILARHGKNHSIPPSQVNFRANILALKNEGCSHILATSACGSLRKEIEPGHIIFPDQFMDFTKRRDTTYFEDFSEKITHTPMSEPFCFSLREALYNKSQTLDLHSHKKGTVITIEGPRFSSKAESHMFRILGGDIINMSTVPEVTLAREAKIHYAVIAMSTDYDCWKDDEEAVHWDIIVQRMKQNAENVKKLLLEVIPHIKNLTCEICTS